MPAQTNTPDASGQAAAPRFIRPVSSDDPAVGGKVRSLGKLRALGLPTPPAFAVSSALGAAIGPPDVSLKPETIGDEDPLPSARSAFLTAPFPTGFLDELNSALDALPPAEADRPAVSFAVRSSSPIEDREDALGAGIYESEMPVERVHVADAIRRVLASALSPGAWRYVTQSAPDVAGQPLAVLVHPFILGQASGSAASGSHANEDPTIEVTRGILNSAERAEITVALQRASAAFGAVELEWVADGARVIFLQLRPHKPLRPTSMPNEGPTVLPAPWQWDAAHNPAPLSPAQTGLVEWVDAACDIGIRQRVVNGYLFWRPSETPSRQSPSQTQIDDPANVFAALTAATLPQIQALGDRPPLEPALRLYADAYQILFGTIAPACGTARAALRERLRTGDVALTEADCLRGVESAASRRLVATAEIARASTTERQARVDEYLNAFGDESARWDIAEPTWRESPQRLWQLASRGTALAANNRIDWEPTIATLPPASRDDWRRHILGARNAAALGEDDDAFFAKLQALIRRALLGIGESWRRDGLVLAEDDVFYVPLSLCRAWADPARARVHAPEWAERLKEPDTINLAELAAAGRAAMLAAEHRSPALARAPGGPHRTRVMRGLPGSAGRIVGRAVHHPSQIPDDGTSILVAATLLPTELPLLSPGGIISETGSPLGHVAAQSRERGIPAIVGVTNALALIPPGTRLQIDGQTGEIICLDEPA